MTEQRLLKTRDAAIYLGITETALRQKVFRGSIPQTIVKKIGGSVYYDRIALDKWLDEMGSDS